MGAANVINRTYAPILRTAGWHQTDSGLLWIPPSMKIVSPPSDLGVTKQVVWREGIVVRAFELHNRSGGVASVGIGGRMANRHWIAGTLTSDGATFTDRTAGYQSTTATIFGADGATNDSVVILSRQKFNWVSANISTAEVDAGNAVDHAVKYSTGATWTAIGANQATTDGFTLSNTPLAQGVHDFVMFDPADWTVTAGNGGVPNGYYGLLITSAQMGAGDTAGLVSGLEIGNMLVLEGLADNGIWEIESIDYWMPYCESLVAYFSTANAGNRVYAEVLSR